MAINFRQRFQKSTILWLAIKLTSNLVNNAA
jgi:hypothetical protein